MELLLSGKLNQHLHEIEEECFQRMEALIGQMKEIQGVTEELKAKSQMKWVGMMNQIQASAEEVVLVEMVYN